MTCFLATETMHVMMKCSLATFLPWEQAINRKKVVEVKVKLPSCHIVLKMISKR